MALSNESSVIHNQSTCCAASFGEGWLGVTVSPGEGCVCVCGWGLATHNVSFGGSVPPAQLIEVFGVTIGHTEYWWMERDDNLYNSMTWMGFKPKVGLMLPTQQRQQLPQLNITTTTIPLQYNTTTTTKYNYYYYTTTVVLLIQQQQHNNSGHQNRNHHRTFSERYSADILWIQMGLLFLTGCFSWEFRSFMRSPRLHCQILQTWRIVRFALGIDQHPYFPL